ncbi:Uncharacterized protein Rs2_21543 [Raphanus sativus]|nr:Uncharacterized protein Rs2_21543 [Raphanus sativus]
MEITLLLLDKSVVFVKPETKPQTSPCAGQGHHQLHALLPEKHHVTPPESWNHHTPWRKTMVMENQRQKLVDFLERLSDVLRNKNGSLLYIRRSRINGEQIQILACLSESKGDIVVSLQVYIVDCNSRSIRTGTNFLIMNTRIHMGTF